MKTSRLVTVLVATVVFLAGLGAIGLRRRPETETRRRRDTQNDASNIEFAVVQIEKPGEPDEIQAMTSTEAAHKKQDVADEDKQAKKKYDEARKLPRTRPRRARPATPTPHSGCRRTSAPGQTHGQNPQRITSETMQQAEEWINEYLDDGKNVKGRETATP